MKKKTPTAPSQYQTRPRIVPTHSEISVEAEVLWRQRGCPSGQDDQIWLEAELQLLHVPRLARHGADRIALSDPLSRLDRKSDDVMSELEELFPAGKPKATTSL